MSEIAVRESRSGGLGVFTLERLETGQTVRELQLGRQITDQTPLLPNSGERLEHCALIDGKLYLVSSPDRHFNHSCDPNVYQRFVGSRIEVVARRDIEAGSELTLDYLINNPGGNSWPCRCGARRCRGTTGISFFTLPPEIQREYIPLLAPWFIERYADKLREVTRRLATT